MMHGDPHALDRERFDALVFDLDGVLTDSASLHMRAWKEVFDDVLRDLDPGGRPFSEEDYRRYVDGKPRYDGVRGFLESRGIELPAGDPDDPPGTGTICGVGNRKNRRFLELLDREGSRRFEDAVAFLRSARGRSFRTAMITSSRNGRRVLAAADLERFMDAVLDGEDAAALGLPGKPDPAVFLAAADRLDVPPSRTVVFEDSRAGVEAASRGGFGRVVGISRSQDPAQREALEDAGADVVVRDLSELELGAHRVENPEAGGDAP